MQRFVDEFNSENSNIAVTFLGPFIVSANVIVRLQNTDRIMNNDEIAVFESAFLEVVVPLDDDVSLSSAKVYFQEEHVEGRRRLSTTISTDVSVRVDGTCKACTSGEFGLLVNDAVGSSSSILEEELKKNDDGEYFDDVAVSDVTQESLSPTRSESTAAEAAVPNKFPYAVLYALAGGVAVVLAGVFYIANRNRNAKLLEDAQIKEEQRQHVRHSQYATESY